MAESKATKKKMEELGMTMETLAITVETLCMAFCLPAKEKPVYTTFHGDITTAFGGLIDTKAWFDRHSVFFWVEMYEDNLGKIADVISNQGPEINSSAVPWEHIVAVDSVAFACRHILHITNVLQGLPKCRRLYAWCRALICAASMYRGIRALTRFDMLNHAITSIEACEAIAISKLLLHPDYFYPISNTCPRGMNLLATSQDKATNFAVSMAINKKTMANLLRPSEHEACPECLSLLQELATCTFRLTTGFVDHWVSNKPYEHLRNASACYLVCIKTLGKLYNLGMTSTPKRLPNFYDAHSVIRCTLPSPTSRRSPNDLFDLWRENRRRYIELSRIPVSTDPPTAFNVIPDEEFEKVFVQTLNMPKFCETAGACARFEGLVYKNGKRNFECLVERCGFTQTFRATHKVVDIVSSHPKLGKNPAVVLRVAEFCVEFCWSPMYGFESQPFYGASCPMTVERYWNLGVGVVPMHLLGEPLSSLRDYIRRRVREGFSIRFRVYDPQESLFMYGYLYTTGDTESVFVGTRQTRRNTTFNVEDLEQTARSMEARWSQNRSAFVSAVTRAGIRRLQKKAAEENAHKRLRRGKR